MDEDGNPLPFAPFAGQSASNDLGNLSDVDIGDNDEGDSNNEALVLEVHQASPDIRDARLIEARMVVERTLISDQILDQNSNRLAWIEQQQQTNLDQVPVDEQQNQDLNWAVTAQTHQLANDANPALTPPGGLMDPTDVALLHGQQQIHDEQVAEANRRVQGYASRIYHHVSRLYNYMERFHANIARVEHNAASAETWLSRARDSADRRFYSESEVRSETVRRRADRAREHMQDSTSALDRAHEAFVTATQWCSLARSESQNGMISATTIAAIDAACRSLGRAGYDSQHLRSLGATAHSRMFNAQISAIASRALDTRVNTEISALGRMWRWAEQNLNLLLSSLRSGRQ
jgi:hypothetical protein